MSQIKPKKIIRICRTWPNKDFRSIGLHAYNYTKYINVPTEIFLKDSLQNHSLLNLDNANFKTIKYYDLKFTSKNHNLISYLLIAVSKLIGEIIMFFNIIFRLNKHNIQNSIIHIHSANYMISGILISRFFKIPVILQLGGIDILKLRNHLYTEILLS